MKTEVIMYRELLGGKIKQKSQSEFFSANDLIRIGNKWRINNDLELFNINVYLSQVHVKEFIAELEQKYGVVKIMRRGRAKDNWVHPLLFIDIALAISPALKLEVYEWLFDGLIQIRNYSGDSYRKMCGELFTRTANKKYFYKEIAEIAERIKIACKVDNWETATKEQLYLRDKIHDRITVFSDHLRNSKEAVNCVISKIDKL